MRAILRAVGLLSSLLMLGLAPDAMAQPVPVCFNLSPFIDILRLSVEQPIPPTRFFVFGVDWDGIDDAYHLLGGGTAYGEAPTNIIGLQLVVQNTTIDFFSGIPICTLQGTLDPTTLMGPFSFDCQAPEQPFVNGGDFVPIPCNQVGPVAQALMSEGRARAGDRP